MVSTVNQYRTLFQDEPKKSKCIEYRYFFLLIEFVLKNVGEWLKLDYANFEVQRYQFQIQTFYSILKRVFVLSY